MTHPNDEEIDVYADPEVKSLNGPIPRFLTWSYILLPLWGFVTAYYFWNGSIGWFDRGYWRELQVAANTTFPIENQNMPLEEQIKPEPVSE